MITTTEYRKVPKFFPPSQYIEIFKKRIETLTDPDTEALSKIKNDIRDAYSDGKITELHYNLLNEKISDMFNNK